MTQNKINFLDMKIESEFGKIFHFEFRETTKFIKNN